jgi:hypothetical protein
MTDTVRVPTKREAALADLAKLDGETMDLAASPQGEGSSADAPMEAVALPAISHDGPHKPGEHRIWLARQLLDSRLTEDEAYSTVAHSPAISDFHPTPIKPSGDTGEAQLTRDEAVELVGRGEWRLKTNTASDAEAREAVLNALIAFD